VLLPAPFGPLAAFPRQKWNATAAPTGKYPSAHKRFSVFRTLYLRALPISLNTVLTFVPTVWTAVIMKTAISEAIKAYSIAVAPDSLARNFVADLYIETLLLLNIYPAARSIFLPPDTGQTYPPRLSSGLI